MPVYSEQSFCYKDDGIRVRFPILTVNGAMQMYANLNLLRSKSQNYSTLLNSHTFLGIMHQLMDEIKENFTCDPISHMGRVH